MPRRRTPFYKIAIIAFAPVFFVYIIAALLAYGPINYFLDHYWLSPFFHTLGGALVGWGLLVVYSGMRTRWKLKISPRWLFALCFMGMVALVGVLWEVYEFVLGIIIDKEHQPGVADTMADLILDLLGGGAVLLFFMYHIRPKWLK